MLTEEMAMCKQSDMEFSPDEIQPASTNAKFSSIVSICILTFVSISLTIFITTFGLNIFIYFLLLSYQAVFK